MAPTDITERESDVIAAVSGATSKDNKESRRKPPLKDHETWPKEKRRAWMLENLKLSTGPVLNTPQKVDRAVEFFDGFGTSTVSMAHLVKLTLLSIGFTQRMSLQLRPTTAQSTLD
jgi:hypothetical protein